MTRFTLYSIDVRDLVELITTKINDHGQPDAEGGRLRYEHAHFDIDDDGNIVVTVTDKGRITL